MRCERGELDVVLRPPLEQVRLHVDGWQLEVALDLGIDPLIQQWQFSDALCAPPAALVLSLGFLHVLTSHRPRNGQPQVLSRPEQKAA